MKSVMVVMVVMLTVLLFSKALAVSYDDGWGTCQIQLTTNAVYNDRFWTLTNVSDQAFSGWDVVVDKIIPFNIKSPYSTLAPTGWEWDGDSFEISPTQMYHTPPALGPGQSLTFVYQIDPQGWTINSDPCAPTEGILCRVEGVVPNSGDCYGEWQSKFCDFGKGPLCSWHEKVCPVPDASTFLLSLTGLAAFGGLLRRRTSRA